jgi:ATP-dependent RNA helicase DDX31/DBP7
VLFFFFFFFFFRKEKSVTEKMADDDGMMLNFEPMAPSEGQNAHLKQGRHMAVKGSWKKKRITQKIIHHKIAKSLESQQAKQQAATQQKHEPVLTKPSIKSNEKKVTESVKNNPNSTVNSLKPQSSTVPVNGNFVKGNPVKPGGFISSLFTGNPEIEKDHEPKEDTNTSAVKVINSSNALPTSSTSNFNDLGIIDILSQHLDSKMEIKIPTKIQRSAIAAITNSLTKDAVIQAQTGSGKTL